MKYAFLGAGKMAMALIQGALRANLCSPSEIIVSSRSPSGLETLASVTGVRSGASNVEAVSDADAILLCVKPADALKAVQEAGNSLAGKLLISVVTGLKIFTLREAATGARVIRAMPNTAAMVGRSATALAIDSDVTRADISTAEQLFSAVGEIFMISENQLDAVTGLSGSGPAYIYAVIEAMANAGSELGMDAQVALKLSAQTVQGAARMLLDTGKSPKELIEMVMSPGGTTVAGMGVLVEKQVHTGLIAAVKAAAKRSKELGQK